MSTNTSFKKAIAGVLADWVCMHHSPSQLCKLAGVAFCGRIRNRPVLENLARISLS